MEFVTRDGDRVAILDYQGHSSPFEYKGWIHMRLAINGEAFEPHCELKELYQEELHTLSEAEFWQNRADYARLAQEAIRRYGHA